MSLSSESNQKLFAQRSALDIYIEPVISQSQIQRFYQLPFALYKGFDCWVPPLKSHVLGSAGLQKTSFYHHAESQCYLATDGKNDYGRITAIINYSYIDYTKQCVGFFGFFESVNSTAVADALICAAASWCREKGMKSMLGPVQPSLNHECGLLVEGFDRLPHMGMPYNKSYYASLFDKAGLFMAKDLLALGGTAETIASIDPFLFKLSDRIQNRLGIAIRSVSARTYKNDLHAIHSIYNRSLIRTWGFAPISTDEWLELAKRIRSLIIPELCLIAECQGKPIGSILCIPNYSQRLRKLDGNLFPLGFMRLLSFRSRIREIRAASTNIIPEYHGQGASIVLLKHLLDIAINRNLREVEFSWVLECNHLSRSSLERAGFQQTKRYRLYEQNLISAPPS